MNGVLVDSAVKTSGFDVASLEASKVVKVEDNFQLTAADRCDRCGAQAYVELGLSEGGKLLFCAHHYTQVKAAILPIVASGRDESAKLLKRAHIED